MGLEGFKKRLHRFKIRLKIFAYSREVQELESVLQSDRAVKLEYFANLRFLKYGGWHSYKVHLEKVYVAKVNEVWALEGNLVNAL